ncbi:hypothetical protein C8J56DRAFT_720209, partial [Mycena floridula]
PLAYIEWYTPFRDLEPVTDLQTVRHSTNNHLPSAAVVSVKRLARSCHLIAKCG